MTEAPPPHALSVPFGQCNSSSFKGSNAFALRCHSFTFSASFDVFNYDQRGVAAVGQRKALIIVAVSRGCNPMQCKHFDCLRNKALQQFLRSGDKEVASSQAVFENLQLSQTHLSYVGGAKDLREDEQMNHNSALKE